MNQTFNLKSGVSESDPGFFLVVALFQTLKESELLNKFSINTVNAYIEGEGVEVEESPLPFLVINETVYENYNENLYVELYKTFSSDIPFNSESLHFWLRAGSSASGSVSRYYSEVINVNIVANIISKGGNLIIALKL